MSPVSSRIPWRIVAPTLCLLLAAHLRLPTAAADWGTGVLVCGGAPTAHVDVQLFRSPPTDVLVVWMFLGGAGRLGLAQRMTSDGAIVWPSCGAGLNADGWAGRFPATLDGTGGVFVTFEISGAMGHDVYLERVRGDATHEPPTGVGWPVATSATVPKIAADGAGGTYVGWLPGSANNVKLKRFLPDGSPAPGWPAAGLSLSAPGQIFTYGPAVDGDGAGGAYALWAAYGDQARALRVNSDGTIAAGWPAGGLALGPSQFGANTWIFPSGDGRIGLWLDGGSQFRPTLQRFLPNGTLDSSWPAGGLVAVDVSASISLYRFVSDGQGGVTLLWEQSGLPRALHVLANGTIAPGYSPSGNSPLDAGAQYAGGFEAATGSSGGLIVAWNDTRPAQPGVRVRWLASDGTPDPSEPDTGRVATPAGAAVTVRGAIDDGAGGVYVAWQEGDAFEYKDLWMNRLVSSALVGVEQRPVAVPALALRAPAPNPASRELSVRLALPSDAPAHLELLDLAGRRVGAQELTGAGERTVRLDGLDRVAPGVYLLRLTQGRESRFVRLAVMR